MWRDDPGSCTGEQCLLRILATEETPDGLPGVFDGVREFILSDFKGA